MSSLVVAACTVEHLGSFRQYGRLERAAVKGWQEKEPAYK